MNVMALLGILCLLYSGVVLLIAIKKPPKIWQMGKIQMFVKVLGEQGTVYFFYGFAVLFDILGLWLLLQ